MPPKKERKPLKRTPLKKKRKNQGEREVHFEIWDERPHVCFVTGENLERYCDEYSNPPPILFSHILPKSVYGKYRTLKENIVLNAPHIHTQWEHGDRSGPEFKEMRDEHERLKARYNREYTVVQRKG